jgi:hypothetical protein
MAIGGDSGVRMVRIAAFSTRWILCQLPVWQKQHV